MKRAKLNYWMDVVMGVAFVVSAVSGLVFLLPAGYLSNDEASVLGISYRLWDLLHIWGSLAMIAGVGGHLLLHTKWIVAMTRKLLVPGESVGARPATSPAARGLPSAGATDLRRRRWLKLGGGILGLSAVAAGGISLFGLRAVLGEDDAVGDSADSVATQTSEVGTAVKSGAPKASADTADLTEQPSMVVPDPTDVPVVSGEVEVDTAPTATPTPELPVEAAQELCVRCPHGLVNDPYPGRCRRYTDLDGDRICDLSIPQVCG